jgi:serine/threonine-protein kinase RsbW
MTEDPRPPISLVIPSRLASVGPLGEQVRAACVRLGLTAEAAGEVEICVVEAVNNAIEHAYQMADDRQVDVILESDGEFMRVVIRDEGQPMPRGTLRRATAPEFNIEDQSSLPEGGMGLYLVKELMDSVRYERKGGKNVLTMERRVDRPPRP